MSKIALSRRQCLVLAATGAGVCLPGCFGGFDLTRKLYQFNASVNDRWIRWLVLLLFVGLGVYMFASFLDLLVFNSIEFWTGKAVLSARQAKDRSSARLSGEGSDQVRIWSESEHAVHIELQRNRASVATLQLLARPNGIELVVREAGGDRHRYRVGDEGGRVDPASLATVVTNTHGDQVARMSATQGHAAMQAIKQGHAPLEVMLAIFEQQGPKRARI